MELDLRCRVKYASLLLLILHCCAYLSENDHEHDDGGHGHDGDEHDHDHGDDGHDLHAILLKLQLMPKLLVLCLDVSSLF
jgi:hypothetical protein